MNKQYCECCGAKLLARWVRLSAGRVEFLAKFRALVIENNKNLINVPKEMSLTEVEYSDYQKLRYHGLIAKYKIDGIIQAGYWILTNRGNLFLNGELIIPEKVKIFKNKIVGYSENRVSVKDVIKTEPYWDRYEDIKFEAPSDEEMEISKAKKIKDERRKKKNTTYSCPKCGGKMKKKVSSQEIDNSRVRVIELLFCPDCQYEQKLDDRKDK